MVNKTSDNTDLPEKYLYKKKKKDQKKELI